MRLRLSESHVLTLRRFVFEIVTIIVGVLIALSFDGVAEWRRNRRLVQQAQINIEAELRDNRAQIAGWLEQLPKRKAQIDRGLDLAAELIAHGRKVKEEDLSMNMSFVTLTESARETAAATGAFAHMKYQDVQRYANLYAEQKRFAELQDRMFQQFVVVLPVTRGRLAELDRADLQAWRVNLQLLKQHAYIVGQIGGQLVKSQNKLGKPTTP